MIIPNERVVPPTAPRFSRLRQCGFGRTPTKITRVIEINRVIEPPASANAQSPTSASARPPASANAQPRDAG
jgi:hypothetical protein